MEKSLTVEELLIPRYKVIADFPNSPYKVGEMCPVEIWKTSIFYFEFNKYPHLFKPLQWWEERTPEQMPEYVKVNTEKSRLFINHIHKVHRWKLTPGNGFWCYLAEDKNSTMADLLKYEADVFLPATEAECLNQNKL